MEQHSLFRNGKFSLSSLLHTHVIICSLLSVPTFCLHATWNSHSQFMFISVTPHEKPKIRTPFNHSVRVLSFLVFCFFSPILTLINDPKTNNNPYLCKLALIETQSCLKGCAILEPEGEERGSQTNKSILGNLSPMQIQRLAC